MSVRGAAETREIRLLGSPVDVGRATYFCVDKPSFYRVGRVWSMVFPCGCSAILLCSMISLIPKRRCANVYAVSPPHALPA